MDTKDILIRNLPVETINKIKEVAKENRRSMNNEIVVILIESVESEVK